MKGLSQMDKTDIEKRAVELMKHINYVDDEEAVDVIRIAKMMGFAVGNAMMEEDVDGFIVVDEGKEEILDISTDKLIGVNSDRTLEWKRFIIAHEIAHYILHYSREIDGGMYAHRDHAKGKDTIENDADFFAANLLMPREKFTKKFNELKEKQLELDEIILLLSKKFVVTIETARRRIGELELNG